MNKPKLLYRAEGLLDAKSIQLLLESFQIPSQVNQESAGIVYGFTLGDLGSANIYVDEADFEEADKIITLLEEGKLEISDNSNLNELQDEFDEMGDEDESIENDE